MTFHIFHNSFCFLFKTVLDKNLKAISFCCFLQFVSSRLHTVNALTILVGYLCNNIHFFFKKLYIFEVEKKKKTLKRLFSRAPFDYSMCS